MRRSPGEDHEFATAAEESEIRRAYSAASREGLRRVAPPALLFFILFAFGSGAIELRDFPERWQGLLLLNATYLTCGFGHLLVIRRRPEWTVGSTLVAVWIVHSAVLLYFIVEHGSAELCLMIISALLISQVIVHPWTAGGQLVSAIVPAVGFVLGQHLGLQSQLPPIYPLFALLTMVMLTTVGAGRLDRHRFEAFRRAMLLQRSAEAQRKERAFIEALLDLARAMNVAIGDPQRLASELADHTRRAVGVDWVLVYRWVEDVQGFTMAAAAGVPPVIAEELSAIGGTNEWMSALELFSRGGAATELLRSDPTGELPTALLDRWGIRAIRMQAVSRERRRVGIIACVRVDQEQPFSEAQRRILAAIATQAAVALENAGLVEASRAAERVKGEFVATVSHELRTPLNVILGYVDLILEGTFGPRPREETEALERVRHQSLQLLDLIQGLLDLNRLEVRGMTLSLQRFSIAELIASLRQSIPESWLRSAVALRWDGASAQAMVRSDFHKLEIVLRNLIHNALKFTERGTVAFSAEVVAEQSIVRFIVSDSGPGIPAADLPLIFQMFGQGERGPRAGGVGLGLYIVKRLGDLLGGSIDVESTPGRGSRFTFTLPIEPP